MNLGELLEKYTEHCRMFMHDDPVAGVPSPHTLELVRLAQDDVHHADFHWELSCGKVAELSIARKPVVRLLMPSALLGIKQHRLSTYARSLKDHSDIQATIVNRRNRLEGRHNG